MYPPFIPYLYDPLEHSLSIFASIFQLLTALQVPTKILHIFLNALVHATRLTIQILGFDHPILACKTVFQLNWVHRTTIED